MMKTVTNDFDEYEGYGNDDDEEEEFDDDSDNSDDEFESVGLKETAQSKTGSDENDSEFNRPFRWRCHEIVEKAFHYRSHW